jgi:hypothetical protein
MVLQKSLNTVQNILKSNSSANFDTNPNALASPGSPSPRGSTELPGILDVNPNPNESGIVNNNPQGSSGSNNSDYRRWVMGSIGPTFADFVLGSYIRWIKTMGDDELWKMVSSWNGGRWVRHLDKLEPWSQVL